MKGRNKRFMKNILNLIICLLLLVIFIPSLSGKEITYIERPSGVSSIIAVNKDFSINFQLTYTFINSLDKPAKVEYYFPIKNYLGEGFDIYATNSSALALSVNGTVYTYNDTIQPYSDGGIVFEWYTNKSDNNPSDGIYKLDFGVFAGLEDLYKKSLEIRLPLKKDDFNYLKEPVTYEITPNYQYKSNDHLILYWGEDLDQAIHISYYYEFSLNDFINHHPLEMMIISAIVGIIVGYIIKTPILKYKERKEKQKINEAEEQEKQNAKPKKITKKKKK